MNIRNFTNRQLCEYASLFPTVAALLDHMLFTIGTRYEFNEDSGMVVDNHGTRIDEYPKMTKVKWEKLIAACHAKELKWAEQFGRGNQLTQNNWPKIVPSTRLSVSTTWHSRNTPYITTWCVCKPNDVRMPL